MNFIFPNSRFAQKELISFALACCFIRVFELYCSSICRIKLISYSFYCRLEQSSGCLGCDTRPKLITSVDEPFKGQNSNAWKISKPILSEDFWTTSACEMDNTAVQSCGSISSTSTLPQMHDAHGAGCSSKPSEFVNHGKLIA